MNSLHRFFRDTFVALVLGFVLGLTSSSFLQDIMLVKVKDITTTSSSSSSTTATTTTTQQVQSLRSEYAAALKEIAELKKELETATARTNNDNCDEQKGVIAAAAAVPPAAAVGETTSTDKSSSSSSSSSSPSAHIFCLCATLADCGDFCDSSITYKDRKNRYNMPGSTWTTARNAMYLLAKDRIQRHEMLSLEGNPERWFCFVDGDAVIDADGKQRLLDRLANETESNKIITPNYNRKYPNNVTEDHVLYVYMADAMFNCFATDAMDRYLPYRTAFDAKSWWLSQFDLVYRGNLLEPFLYKMYTDVMVFNPQHGKYPKKLKFLRALRANYFQGFNNDCHPLEIPPSTCIHYSMESNNARPPKTLYTVEFNETHIYKGM